MQVVGEIEVISVQYTVCVWPIKWVPTALIALSCHYAVTNLQAIIPYRLVIPRKIVHGLRYTTDFSKLFYITEELASIYMKLFEQQESKLLYGHIRDANYV